MIKDFAVIDNVKYLELRTPPRHVTHSGMTKASHIEAVLAAVVECHADQSLDIQVRLLLAVDRRTSVEDAWDTLELADRLRTETGGIVKGLDLSGDPRVSSCFCLFGCTMGGCQKVLDVSAKGNK